jgi:hypothetical protein
MATTNLNAARGLIPYRHWDGSYYNGSGNVYSIPAAYATSLFIGDPVDVIGSSNAADGLPAVKLATVASPILGVFMGIVDGGEPIVTVTRDLPIYHPASTLQYCLICDDPTMLFWVQDDGTAQATASSQWAGKNANLVAAAGSTITGYSGWQLASSTVATTNTLDVKIIRPLVQPDNAVSSTANTNQNAKWLVKLNNLRTANQIAGV